MHLQHLPSKSTLLQIGAIMLVTAGAFVTGLSVLVVPSPYAPLAIVGAVVAAVIVAICLRRPLWALYTALFVVCLPTGLIPANIHSFLNRAFTVTAAVAWAVDTIVERRRMMWPPPALAMLVFVAWGILTLLWATNLKLGLNELLTYALRLALFLVLISNQIRTKESLDGLMNTLALNGWVWVLVSAGTVLLVGYTPGTRLQVLETNENELGLSALIGMVGVLWWATQAPKERKAVRTWMASVFLALALGLTALSGSRGSAISLIVALLAFCVWKPTRLWGMQGLLLLVLGVFLAPAIFLTTVQRFNVVRGDTLLGGREALWQAAWRLIWDNPWCGVGIGNGSYRIVPYLRSSRDVWGFESAAIHNPVLTIGAETGAPGLLFYMWVPGSALWSFARQYVQRRRGVNSFLMPYFAIVSCTVLGYMFSWIKGGGMESDFSYFLMVALLMVPSCLGAKALEMPEATFKLSRKAE